MAFLSMEWVAAAPRFWATLIIGIEMAGYGTGVFFLTDFIAHEIDDESTHLPAILFGIAAAAISYPLGLSFLERDFDKSGIRERQFSDTKVPVRGSS